MGVNLEREVVGSAGYKCGEEVTARLAGVGIGVSRESRQARIDSRQSIPGLLWLIDEERDEKVQIIGKGRSQ